jgi:hypothetical protein
LAPSLVPLSALLSTSDADAAAVGADGAALLSVARSATNELKAFELDPFAELESNDILAAAASKSREALSGRLMGVHYSVMSVAR